ncbi:MAG TPA: hypothetical protein VHG72_03845 [Polyangia bacterium]|nr:hypothetical protein [Polyangia bacterium]
MAGSSGAGAIGADAGTSGPGTGSTPDAGVAPSCRQQSDCPTGSTCIPPLCADASCEIPCGDAGACPPDLICRDNGLCETTECAGPGDCASGICLGSNCYRTPGSCKVVFIISI